MKKLLSLTILIGLATLATGCSCERENSEGIIEPTFVEDEIHPLQDNFVGPKTEPFSNGPSEMPPVN
ncbi:hypothetical protein KKD70_01060 [Patescibacteria group bacterium]|nr:hypothetical protein [Patescibacteria group bacterium]